MILGPFKKMTFLGQDPLAQSIVKVLLPKIAPGAKISDYKTVKEYTTWLGELAGGRTWVAEMEAFEEDWLALACQGNYQLASI